MKKNAKQDFTPRAEDLTLEDMAKWMEQCAKSAKSNDPRLTAGQNRLLTADIRKGYTRIADALRAYDKLLKKEECHGRANNNLDIYADLNAEALEVVNNYVRELLVKDGNNIDYKVFIVWQCHMLGSRKWLMSTTLRDGMYYEVIYDGHKGFYYLDAYKKIENRLIPRFKVRKS